MGVKGLTCTLIDLCPLFTKKKVEHERLRQIIIAQIDFL